MKKITPYILLMLLNVLPACGGQTTATVAADAVDDEPQPTVKMKQPSVHYSTADSLRVVELLEKAGERQPEMPRMEYFGRQFLGIPYVGHTLETDIDAEQLVVNLHELDCTTFVETCAALSLADLRGERSFEGFCRALTQLRYKDGVCDGYASRLHYFLTWADNNEAMGFVHNLATDEYPYTAVKMLDLHFMSRNPKYYKQLEAHPEWIKGIEEQESTLKDKAVRYIPKALLNESVEKLGDVRNGDIVGILTTKDGLDTTHIGMAIWQNGRLHLMNASSVYNKVVIDSTTFYDYMAKRKANLGIVLVRLND